ncbi:MAG: nucleotidyltransferase family protein [Rhodoplanes sp.]
MRTLDEVPLTANERQAIEAAAATLRARFPVTDLVLYGSKARGDSDPESDIDLLVLTSRPLDVEEQSGMWSHLHEISMRFGVLLSPLTVDARSWREGVHSVLPITPRSSGRACGMSIAQASRAPTGRLHPHIGFRRRGHRERLW